MWQIATSERQSSEQAGEVVLAAPAAEGGAQQLLAGERADDDSDLGEALDGKGGVGLVPGDERRAVALQHDASALAQRVRRGRGKLGRVGVHRVPAGLVE